MSITEMLQHIGDENISLQNIMHSSPNLVNGKHCGKITFDTDKSKVSDLMLQGATGKKGQWTAIVLWLPTDKLP